MLVTMFTDASFVQRHKRATWAVWAKADGKTERYSGIIRDEVESSCEAELMAIANGLFVVQRRFPLAAGDKIVCQTDSQEAINALFGKHPRVSAKLITSSILSFSSQHELILDLRHVKGHEGNATRRSAVNTWCDNECSARMGELLISLGEEAPKRRARKAKKTKDQSAGRSPSESVSCANI